MTSTFPENSVVDDCVHRATDIEPFVVDIDFDAIPDPKRKKDLLNLPTSFKLSKEQVQKVIDAGGELLKADPEYKALLDGLQH